jgi:hypothetical protein
MISNALFSASVVMLAAMFYVLEECTFLIPYRRMIIERYGVTLALFAAALFINLFAAFYAIGRKLFLKDTGRKLAHLEKQLRTGATISEELTHRLDD